MNFIPLLLVFFTTVILLTAALFLLLEIYVVIIGGLAGAPYVRSKKEKIKTMLKLAGVRPGETVVDLGSGDGTLLIEAGRLGAKAVGVEINPFLVFYTRCRARRLNLRKRITTIYGDFNTYPLGEADVIFLYLWPSTIEKIKEKLNRELKHGARIVSNSFPISGWKPLAEENGIFLYSRS